MRLLLDEWVPRRMVDSFIGHDAHTVKEMGWAGKKNGELLAAMNAQNFECLVTVDQRLPNQQNIAKSGISVSILRANSNRRPDLEVLVPAALLVLSNIAPGEVRVVAATPT